MFLGIKNLGKIETANIEINAITVIAGENNSGKSTVGKTLFCIFNSFYDIDKQIVAVRRSFIRSAIEATYRNVASLLPLPLGFNEKLLEPIIENKDKYINDKGLLQQDLSSLLMQNDHNYEKSVDTAKLNEAASKILRSFDVSDDEVLIVILRRKMQAEFNMQINNLHHPERDGEIVLKIKETEVKIRIRGNENINIANHIYLNTEVMYIDDPYALDDLRLPVFDELLHREHLRLCLTKRKASSPIRQAFGEIITAKKLGRVFEKLNSVCPGEMVNKTGLSFAYRESDSNVLINMANVSTGLKAFIIIKTLLLNGHLEENGTIVLDEPEKHLHPEWQLIFAELIVLIQKEFNMHILINTHSPYFLDAIETYSRKHGVAEKCKYYLAENSGTTSVIYDVHDNIDKIYKKPARPLQDLENER